MALTANQINSIYAALFGPSNLPSQAQLNTWLALDAANGDNAVLLDIVNSPASKQFDYAIVQLIQFVQGTVPNAAQLQGWVQYLEAGNPLSAVVNAFAGSTNFMNNFNNGNAVNVNAPVNATIAQNIIFQALGTIPSQAQVQAWVNTGLTVAQMVAQFSLGDQYSARTQQFVQNFLVEIAAHAAGIPGAAAPSGSLFGVSTLITVTDNTTGHNTTAGNSITYTVSATGVAPGTVEHWTLSGTGLSEVLGATTGTVAIGTNGLGSFTVSTVNSNIGNQTLTLTIDTSGLPTPLPSDTVTLAAPAIQNFTATVGENLIGGAQDTIFQGAIDDKTVGQNTYTSFLDKATGNASFNNTLSLVIFNQSDSTDIIPNATGVQTLQITDINSEASDTNFNLQFMPNLTTIKFVGNDQSQDLFFNVQKVVNIEIDNNDFAGTGSVEVFVINSVATASGPKPVTLTLNNSGSVAIEYQDTSSGPLDSSADFVTSFTIVNSGDNGLQLWGASVATDIDVSGSGSLWLAFDGTASGYSFHDHDLFDLTMIDASALGGTYDTTEYQFGVQRVDIFNDFTFLGAAGHNFVNIVDDTTGNTINVTTNAGNDKIRVDTSFGNGETVTVNSGGGDTTNTHTGSGRGGDSIDLHGWKATNQTLSVTSGDGNNDVNIVSADDANVTVTQGNGDNDIDIDLWNGQVFSYGAAVVDVTVGNGTNDIDVNTFQGGFYDYGSKVTVTAGNGNNDSVDVTTEWAATVSVTEGNGNNDSVDVTSSGYFSTTTIKVGTGSGINVDFNELANYYATNDLVTINVGNLAGGDSSAGGTVNATIQNDDTLNVNAGDGSYDVNVTMAETDQGYTPGGNTVNIDMGNGNNDISVVDAIGFNDHVTINVGGGNNLISVDLSNDEDSSIVINAGSASTTGHDSIGVKGSDNAGNTVDIHTGGGNDWIDLDSLVLGSNITVAGGPGFNTLALSGDVTALENVALVSAHITGIQALEFTSNLKHDVDVLDLGSGNNVSEVTLDKGYTGTFVLFVGNVREISGLTSGSTLNLLQGEQGAGDTLFIPLGNSLANPADVFNIYLNAQDATGNGGLGNENFGEVVLFDSLFGIPIPAGSGTVETVNISSTAFEGIVVPSDPDDYTQLWNHLELDDQGIKTLNINGVTPSFGDPDNNPIDPSTGLPFHDGTVSPSGIQADGDVSLWLDGSNLAGLATVNANTFFASIHDLDGQMGSIGSGTITFNAINTTNDALTFGDAAGDVINVGNFDNVINVGNGAGDVVTTTHTTNVFGSSDGGNVINIGWGNGDKVTLADGSNDVVTINGTAAHTPVDTITFGAGNNNVVNPNFASGSTINFGAHTSNASNFETINLNHLGDSLISLPDVINGLSNNVTNGDHIVFLGSGGGAFDTTLSHYHLQIVADGGAVSSALNGFTTSSTVHDIVFDKSTGDTYIDYNSGSHTAQMELHLVGVSNESLALLSGHVTIVT
jgi:hypothetical protein